MTEVEEIAEHLRTLDKVAFWNKKRNVRKAKNAGRTIFRGAPMRNWVKAFAIVEDELDEAKKARGYMWGPPRKSL